MRAVALSGRGRVELVDRPRPEAAFDVAVVDVRVIPMCAEYRDRRAGVVTDRLGHEAAGVVADPARSALQVGTRVVVMPQYGCGRCWLCQVGEHIYCRHQRDVLVETASEYGTATYAEAVLKPAALLLPVPDDVPLAHAALTGCALGPTFTACVKTRLQPTETVVITGAGPVGLGGVVNAAVRHARVLVIEPSPARRALARQLGAAAALDPAEAVAAVREVTLGVGADVGIEASGHPAAAGVLVELLRPGGRLAAVAWTDLHLPPLPPAGLELYGCWHWNHWQHAPAMWAVLRQAGPLLDRLITHRFPLAEVAAAMDLQDGGACGKVLLHP